MRSVPGGEGMSNPSPETRVKLSAHRRGKKRGPHKPETLAKISAALKGRILRTPESYERSAAKCRGRVVSAETRAKISLIHKGKTIPSEMRAQISAKKTGVKRPETSAEWRASLSRALTGHPVSEETRAKLRAFNLGRRKRSTEEVACLPLMV